MKKTLLAAAVATFVATQAFSAYVVVLRDGTQYKAKAKWTVVNGKALVTLESGQVLQIDPAMIDAARSERTNKMGVTGSLIDLTPDMPSAAAPKQQQPSLGSMVKLKQLPPEKRPSPAPETPLPGAAGQAVAAAAVPAANGGGVNSQVVEKFDRAYENVGIFEKKITASGARGIRAELTTDSEDKVFNAISATSFLLMRNAGIAGAQIETVELFMKTTNGGAAGRFVMTRADAEALDKKTMSQQDYFVRRVIY